MSQATNEQIASSWVLAFNRGDLEALLALYDENCSHSSPKIRAQGGDGTIKGKAALRAWWQGAFTTLSLRYDLTTVTANDDRVFIEYTRVCAGQPDMPIAEVFEIKNGLIYASRVFHG